MNTTKPLAPEADFDIGALYAGPYLKADDLRGKTYTAIIADVEEVELAEPDGGVRRRAVVTLQGWPLKLLLNKTNYYAIAAAYGTRRAGWIDKPIEVYPDQVLFQGKMKACSRVRIPRPAAPAAAVPSVAPPQTAPTAPPAPTAPVGSPMPAGQLPPLMTAGEVSDDIPY